jgi:cell division protein FtsB
LISIARPPAHVKPEHLRKLARVVVIVTVVAIGLAVLAFGVFPTRTWLDQRAGTARAEERLRVLNEQNAALQERIDELSTDEAIEEIARRDHNLVMPGEEAYAILPAPRAAVDLPQIWPFGALVEPPPETDGAGDPAIPRDE